MTGAGQPAEYDPEDTAGRMRAPHGGTDQEAAHADDPVARRVTLRGTRRHPPAVCLEVEGGRRKPDVPERARIRAHEAAHLAAPLGVAAPYPQAGSESEGSANALAAEKRCGHCVPR